MHIMMRWLRKRWPEVSLLMLGAALLAIWSWNAVGSLRFQLAESRKFEIARADAARGGPAGASQKSAGASRAPAAGARAEALGRIEIPRLGIRAMFTEGVDSHTLRHAIGHVPSSALPGSPGNCALAGHRDTFLHGLGGIRAGDIIHIWTIDRSFNYRVEWAEIASPRRVQVLSPTAARSLTLVTCYPFEFVGDAPNRFVVRARQIEDVGSSVDGPGGSPVDWASPAGRYALR